MKRERQTIFTVVDLSGEGVPVMRSDAMAWGDFKFAGTGGQK